MYALNLIYNEPFPIRPLSNIIPNSHCHPPPFLLLLLFFSFFLKALFQISIMAGDGNELFQLYRYEPSMAAAVIFIILFLAITAIHTYQMVRTKTWFFVPFVLGGFCASIYATPL